MPGPKTRRWSRISASTYRRLYTVVFGIGASLAGFAGLMAAPITSVQPGMGEEILILTFVVIVVGGLGSVQGAFLGALLIGMGDTLGRAYLGTMLASVWPAVAAYRHRRRACPPP